MSGLLLSGLLITLMCALCRGTFLPGESFIRKGEAGGWRNYFTEVLSRSSMRIKKLLY